MSDITNTTKEAEKNGLPFILQALALGTNGAIEQMEADGQAELVSSTKLPTEGSDHPAFAAMGLTFGVVDENDPIFREATLPPGWTKKAALDHSMWSQLCDEKGRERASIFYKAAFYDRNAQIHPTPRFSIRKDYDFKKANPGQVKVVVYDGDKPIHVVQFSVEQAIADNPAAYQRHWAGPSHPKAAEPFTQEAFAADVANDQALIWLEERYPDWRDPAAHWDED